MQYLSIVIAALALTHLTACDAEQPDTEPATSGVPAERALSSLDDSEARRVCAARRGLYETIDLDEFVCTSLAANVTPDPQACDAARLRCLADPPELPIQGLDADACVADLRRATEGCTATVGDLERCWRDGFDALGPNLGASCAEAGARGARKPPAPPASCEVLAQRCPGMAG